MSPRVAELLQRRLIFVTGKGGVGKTTVSAAIGLAASRLGLRTLIVELGDDAEIPALLGKPGLETSESAGLVRDSLFHHLLVPEIALREYLEIQLRVRSLVRLAMGNPGIRRLLEAAPGWRDLIRLGKLWHLETRTDAESPLWDLLVVDAPATGHGLTLLSIPDAVVDTVRAGPLRRQAGAVQELIHDPTRTLVLPVTLPEELPVLETVELIGSLKERGLATMAPIANGVHPNEDFASLKRLVDRVAGSETGLPPVPVLRDLLSDAQERAKQEQECLAALRDQVGIALELPLLETHSNPEALIETLAEQLLRAARLD